MHTLGKITTAVLLAALAIGVLAGVKSIPDLKRYARLRAM
jgi:hypothetical protein